MFSKLFSLLLWQSTSLYTHHLGYYRQILSAQYAKLMSYWQSTLVLKNRIEVKYEDLVQNMKLPCNNLYEDLSLTVPAAQSHIHLYQNEIERWKSYQHFLQPLIEVLYDA